MSEFKWHLMADECPPTGYGHYIIMGNAAECTSPTISSKHHIRTVIASMCRTSEVTTSTTMR